MNKKLLCIGAAVLSISSASFASGTMYTTPVPVAVPTGCDTTSDSYFYLGIQGGVAVSGWNAINGQLISSEIRPLLPPVIVNTTWNTKNINSIAGRAFLGYSFNKYFAAEFGYLYVGKQSDIDVNIASVDFNGKTINVFNQELGKVRTQAFDLVGKLKAPITDNFDLYAKLGAGYLMMKGQNNFSFYKANKADLVFGAGASYDFNENWAMDLSWTRYNSGNTKVMSGSWQPNVDFYALGVTFKFAGF